MEKLGKALKLRKAKYRKRTGGPGHYKYFYGEEKGVTKRPGTKAEKKLLTRREAAQRGQRSGLAAKVEQVKSELKKYKKDPKGLPSSILGNLKQLMEKDKATDNYKWLAGFVGSDEKGKAIYGEMKKRGIVGKEKPLKKVDKVYDELMEEGEFEHDPSLHDMITEVIKENPDLTIEELKEEVKATIEG